VQDNLHAQEDWISTVVSKGQTMEDKYTAMEAIEKVLLRPLQEQIDNDDDEVVEGSDAISRYSHLYLCSLLIYIGISVFLTTHDITTHGVNLVTLE
jgi:hypothetical protein